MSGSRDQSHAFDTATDLKSIRFSNDNKLPIYFYLIATTSNVAESQIAYRPYLKHDFITPPHYAQLFNV